MGIGVWRIALLPDQKIFKVHSYVIGLRRHMDFDAYRSIISADIVPKERRIELLSEGLSRSPYCQIFSGSDLVATPAAALSGCVLVPFAGAVTLTADLSGLAIPDVV